jgi:serine protease inhibitor
LRIAATLLQSDVTTGRRGAGPSALDDITIRFNRPFLFFVRDVETGTILFKGRVIDPSDTP